MKTIRSGCAALVAGAALAGNATVIYDPASNTKPSAQGWTTSGFGYTDSVSGGIYSFSTASNMRGQAGSARMAPFALDTQTGFRIDFRLRVLAESHHTDNQRGGFSFIVIGDDPKHALELAFWTDRVWAYDYNAALDDPFVPGPGKDRDTTVWTHYALAVSQQQFTFSADGNALFSGMLQDYTAKPMPYAQPNFLFFGDDTTRASASVELGAVQLAAVPEPAQVALMLLGLAALGWRLRRG